MITPSPDQRLVYEAINDWVTGSDGGYLTVGGLAGTGKSSLIALLGQQHPNLVYCAYTGKATSVLKRKLREADVTGHVGTIHSLIYFPVVDEKGRVIGWEKRPGKHEGDWGREHGMKDNPLADCSLIVVDEASMISNELWTDLLSYEIPILAVGDHGQLPPVSQDAINLMADPVLKLEKIHRQAAGNPILNLAHRVRNGENLRRFVPTDDRVRFARSVKEGWVGLKVKDPLDAAVICYRNKTRVSLNGVVRGLLGRTGSPIANDVVICLKNDKPLFNGLRGVIVEVEGITDEPARLKARVAFPDDGLTVNKWLCKTQFGREKTYKYPGDVETEDGVAEWATSWSEVGKLFDYGYVLTAHKAQGSQFKDVIVGAFDLFGEDDFKRRWLYTVCTRASDRLVVV